MLIDKARAESAMVRAGATTLQMQSDVLRVARLDTDPSFAMKGESEAFAESAPAFGSVQLVAKTIGCLVRISEELLRDSGNAGEVVDAALRGALAAELDRQFLRGTGSGELTGLQLADGLHDEDAFATYDDALDAMAAVEGANVQPAAVIANPATWATIRKLKDGQQYLRPPDSFAALTQISTTNCPKTASFLGDFRHCLIGFAGPIAIEMDAGGVHFDRYERAFRAVARVALAIGRPADIARLAA
jgi:HK97 family phage major capsid protein